MNIIPFKTYQETPCFSGLNIISKYEYSSVCLSAFVGLSLQWLHLPSYLTNNALKVATKIIDIHQNTQNPDPGLLIANLKYNETFQALVQVDKDLYILYKLLHTWESLKDNDDKLKSWFEGLISANDQLKLEMFTFFVGVVTERQGNLDVVLKVIRLLVDLVRVKKEVSVTVLPVLLYKIANDARPTVKMECLKSLPLMATTKVCIIFLFVYYIYNFCLSLYVHVFIYVVLYIN